MTDDHMHLMPRDALAKKRRPTFSECLKAIRGAAGDKRRFTETSTSETLTFKFTIDEVWRYNKAFNALARLNPFFGEQYTHDDDRRMIHIFRRLCEFCGQRYSEHQPAGGQCLFAATRYKEKTGDS